MSAETDNDTDLALDEAFDALVVATEHDEHTSPDASVRLDLEAAALQALLPARGMTTPGWDATSAQPPRASISHAMHTPSEGTATTSTHGARIFCPTCNGAVDVRSRHVAVHRGAVRVYCSAECLDRRDALPAEAEAVAIAMPPKRRRTRWLAALLVPAGAAAYLATGELRDSRDRALVPPTPALATTIAPAPPTVKIADDPQRDADAKLVDELSHDAWIHPLAGPSRRMPRNHNGAFGADRAGERPPECVSGHCGVDLGYVWGERVFAVHEGVVDFVNRGPNEERGGVFVRIAHRDGTLYSWYFHLAAVPKSIRPGVKVQAGEMIGLVGDTGIKHSAPHLHFALSVKTSKHVRERYLDPEPLIAIWPLWLPDADGKGGKVVTDQEPGVPVRAAGGGSKRSKRVSAKPEARAAKAAKADGDSAGGSTRSSEPTTAATDAAPAGSDTPAAAGTLN